MTRSIVRYSCGIQHLRFEERRENAKYKNVLHEVHCEINSQSEIFFVATYR